MWLQEKKESRGVGREKEKIKAVKIRKENVRNAHSYSAPRQLPTSLRRKGRVRLKDKKLRPAYDREKNYIHPIIVRQEVRGFSEEEQNLSLIGKERHVDLS